MTAYELRISDWSSDVCSSDLLDLSECVVTGSTCDIAFVSPKSGGAVSAAAAAGYETRLLRLPPFMRHDNPDEAAPDSTMADILDFLAITGHFLARDVLDGRNRDLLMARERLTDRLGRAVEIGRAHV